MRRDREATRHKNAASLCGDEGSRAVNINSHGYRSPASVLETEDQFPWDSWLSAWFHREQDYAAMRCP
jgi:hypothetical protein